MGDKNIYRQFPTSHQFAILYIRQPLKKYACILLGMSANLYNVYYITYLLEALVLYVTKVHYTIITRKSFFSFQIEDFKTSITRFLLFFFLFFLLLIKA